MIIVIRVISWRRRGCDLIWASLWTLFLPMNDLQADDLPAKMLDYIWLDEEAAWTYSREVGCFLSIFSLPEIPS